jgi:hypothetical protein
VTVCHGLDWVVPKLGQHTMLERADQALGPADRPDIVCGLTLDADRTGLANI